LVSVVEADGLEDRLAAGEWTALEGDLRVGRSGPGGSARALALRPLPHRVPAEWQGYTYPHQSTDADRSLSK